MYLISEVSRAPRHAIEALELIAFRLSAHEADRAPLRFVREKIRDFDVGMLKGKSLSSLVVILYLGTSFDGALSPIKF